MREKTACFTGHRIIDFKDTETIQIKLQTEIIKLIKNGVRYFGDGGAIGFDTLAANMIIDLKREYSHIRLIMVLPCRNQSERWNTKQKQTYEYILSKADKIVYLSETYYEGCMLERNRHLVNNSNYCIAYLRSKKGGTFYTVNYAVEQGVNVIMLD